VFRFCITLALLVILTRIPCTLITCNIYTKEKKNRRRRRRGVYKIIINSSSLYQENLARFDVKSWSFFQCFRTKKMAGMIGKVESEIIYSKDEENEKISEIISLPSLSAAAP